MDSQQTLLILTSTEKRFEHLDRINRFLEVKISDALRNHVLLLGFTLALMSQLTNFSEVILLLLPSIYFLVRSIWKLSKYQLSDIYPVAGENWLSYYTTGNLHDELIDMYLFQIDGYLSKINVLKEINRSNANLYLTVHRVSAYSIGTTFTLVALIFIINYFQPNWFNGFK